MMYRRSVRNQLDRLIGNETADRLFDAATPPPKSPAKVDKKFRGLSQAQLRRTKVSFEFVDVPVDWGVDWFQRSMGMDIRWNSSVDRILFLGYYGSVQAQDLRSLQALARSCCSRAWRQR